MKICYIYQDQYPWDIRAEKIVSALSASGIETHVLSRNRTGAKRLEVISNTLAYHRLPIGYGQFSRWILNFPAFFSPSWIWATYCMVRNYSINLIIVRDLPLAPMAVLVAKLTGIKVVMDMAEDYPAMIRAMWTYRGPTVTDYLIRNPRLLRVLESWVLGRLDGLFTVSEASKRRVKSNCSPDAQISVIENTPVLRRERSSSEHPLAIEMNRSSTLKLLYVGGLEESRGLSTVIKAIQLIRRSGLDVRLYIVGLGTSERMLRELATREGVENSVVFAGWIDNYYVPAIIAAADICLVPHFVNDHTNTTIPNKIYDYMAQSKPVVVSNCESLVQIVNDYECGLHYSDDHNFVGLAQAISKLADRSLRDLMGSNGREAVIRRLNWDYDAEKLLRAIASFSPKMSP